MQIGNLFARAEVPDEGEHFETLLRTQAVTLERIISRGQASPPGFWYDQDRDEWVALLLGEAVLIFEEGAEHVRLQAGDFLLIPAHKRHRVEKTSPDAVWLALHYDS